MRVLSRDNLKRRTVSIQKEGLIRTSSLEEGGLLPLVITPNLSGVDLSGWIVGNRSLINEQLLKHGGILFRGFPLKDREDFQGVLDALDIPLMNYVEGATPRTALTKKVYTSTEYPQEYRIQLHNELSYVVEWPMKICFFCETPAETGGETIIADMRRVYDRIPQEIKEEFERRKWRLVRNYNPNFSLTWQRSFGVNTKEEIAEYCSQANLDYVWKTDDILQTSCVRNPIRVHPETGEKIWFNHTVFWHPSMLDEEIRDTFLKNFETDDLPYNTTYGDGGIIDDEVIRIIHQIQEEETVTEPWQTGDFMLLDNMLVSHGRNPFKGERSTLAAMGESSKRYENE